LDEDSLTTFVATIVSVFLKTGALSVQCKLIVQTFVCFPECVGMDINLSMEYIITIIADH